MSSGTTGSTSSQRLGADRELGVESVCCLLHNLIAGGAARQWIRLLARHVEDGGRATIVAPPGPLSGAAREAGIEVVDHQWEGPPAESELRRALAGHEVAIVHWDHRVMNALDLALSTCGRAALVLHQTPAMLARWFGPGILPEARIPVDRALESRNAVVLVRGRWHRHKISLALRLPGEELLILPPAIPLPALPFETAEEEPQEVLALTRLSPEKAAIVEVAAGLVRARLGEGRRCRLTVAGEGEWRDGAAAICERALPADAWRIEDAPSDPIGRLAAAALVVAQGTTTLEAAALGRRVVVARPAGDDGAAGVVLTPANYEPAAGDPFGRLPLNRETAALWPEALALGEDDLAALRGLVERHNSLEVAAGALAEALASTA